MCASHSYVTEGALRHVLTVKIINGKLNQAGIVEAETCPQDGYLFNRVRIEVSADVFKAGAC